MQDRALETPDGLTEGKQKKKKVNETNEYQSEFQGNLLRGKMVLHEATGWLAG